MSRTRTARRPSIPFWNGEAPGRTLELSREVSRLRERIVGTSFRLADMPIEFLMRECGLDRMAAEQAAEYVLAGRAALGALPTHQTVVAERFFDEAGGMQLVLHAPFGSRINRAWGLALRKRFCRSFNLELQAAATDNGIVISLSEQHAFPLEIIFEFLRVETVEHVLTQAMLDAPMFTARWRWNASRALAVLRFRGGRKTPPPIQRMQSDDLLAAVFPDQAACAENLTGEIRIPDHPLVNETISNCLREAMDLDGLKTLLAGIQSGAIEDRRRRYRRAVAVLARDPQFESLRLSRRRAARRAPRPRRAVAAHAAHRYGAGRRRARCGRHRRSGGRVLAGGARRRRAARRAADPDHGPGSAGVARLLRTTRSRPRRATTLIVETGRFWVPAERLDVARLVHPDGILHPRIDPAGQTKDMPADAEAAAAFILRGWLESSGPVTVAALAEKLAIPPDLIETALAKIEGEGQVLRGSFTGTPEQEWCNRRVLARIHRLTLGRLRREIEPVSTADFLRFLSRWQHVARGAQLHGVDGLLQVIRQLQGYEISAAAWESEILPRRIARYTPDLLDQLCLSGEVMWGRLSPHPAFESRRAAPRAADARRAHCAVPSPGRRMADRRARRFRAHSLPRHPRNLRRARKKGASFFAELVRATGRLPSEVEDGLWELVAAGLVTADAFENLRSLVDPKRRRGEGRGRTFAPQTRRRPLGPDEPRQP